MDKDNKKFNEKIIEPEKLISKFRFYCLNKTPTKFNIIYVQNHTLCDKNCYYCYLEKSNIKNIKNDKNDKIYNYYYKAIDLFKTEFKNNLGFAMVGGEPILYDFNKNFELFLRYKNEKFVWFSHLLHDEIIFEKFLNNFNSIYEIHEKYDNSIINMSLHLPLINSNTKKLFFQNLDKFISLYPNIDYHINVVFDDKYISKFNSIIKYIQKKNYKFYLTLKDNNPKLLKYFNINQKEKYFNCYNLLLNPNDIWLNDNLLYEFNRPFNDKNYIKLIKKIKKDKNNYCDNFNNCEDQWKGMTISV